MILLRYWTVYAILAAFALIPGAPLDARPVVVLQVTSDGDELSFKPTHLTCVTGAAVKMVFHHGGEIIDDPHDWVLLKPGALKQFLADAAKESDENVIVTGQTRRTAHYP